MACKQPTYIMEMTNGMEVENPLIELVFATSIVEYNIDSISYDLQSLIGEIGGTLGLTLGLSFYSLLDLVEYLEQKFMKWNTPGTFLFLSYIRLLVALSTWNTIVLVAIASMKDEQHSKSSPPFVYTFATLCKEHSYVLQ